MINLHCNITETKVPSDPLLVTHVCPFALVLLIRKITWILLDYFCTLEYTDPVCQFCALIPIMVLFYGCRVEVKHFSPSENLAQCSYQTPFGRLAVLYQTLNNREDVNIHFHCLLPQNNLYIYYADSS